MDSILVTTDSSRKVQKLLKWLLLNVICVQGICFFKLCFLGTALCLGLVGFHIWSGLLGTMKCDFPSMDCVNWLLTSESDVLSLLLLRVLYVGSELSGS